MATVSELVPKVRAGRGSEAGARTVLRDEPSPVPAAAEPGPVATDTPDVAPGAVSAALDPVECAVAAEVVPAEVGDGRATPVEGNIAVAAVTTITSRTATCFRGR
jgi:hypothetical protein